MKTKIRILLLILLGTGGMVKAQQQNQVQKQDRIHLEEHYRFYKGKLYQYKDGVQSPVTEQVRLKNGTVINPDGSYQLQNQERYQLRSGECIDLNGLHYRTHNQFNKRRSIPNKQISPNVSGGMNKNKSVGSRRGSGVKRGISNLSF